MQKFHIHPSSIQQIFPFKASPMHFYWKENCYKTIIRFSSGNSPYILPNISENQLNQKKSARFHQTFLQGYVRLLVNISLVSLDLPGSHWSSEFIPSYWRIFLRFVEIKWYLEILIYIFLIDMRWRYHHLSAT